MEISGRHQMLEGTLCERVCSTSLTVLFCIFSFRNFVFVFVLYMYVLMYWGDGNKHTLNLGGVRHKIM